MTTIGRQTDGSSWWTPELTRSKVVLQQKRPEYPGVPNEETTDEEAVRARRWALAQQAADEFSPGVTQTRIDKILEALKNPRFAKALREEDDRLGREKAERDRNLRRAEEATQPA